MTQEIYPGSPKAGYVQSPHFLWDFPL